MMFKPHDHWFIGPPDEGSRISMRLTSWKGGKRPVAADAQVYIILRSGDIYMYPQTAGEITWEHLPWWIAWAYPYEHSLEVVGYRLALQSDCFDGYQTLARPLRAA